MTVLYEDNHLLIVSKAAGEIVQGDKTGDATLADAARAYIKEKYQKPGEVFLGIPHRIDRPTSGIVVLCRTSKSLTRMSNLFRDGEVHKTYHAIVPRIDAATASRLREAAKQSALQGTYLEDEKAGWHTLQHYLTRNERQNKSYAHTHAVPQSKHALLQWRETAQSDRYSLLEVRLLTGRHHQIRCQLAAIGLPIRGDLKYGAPRSNPDGSICLHARSIDFVHPVSKKPIHIEAPYPALPLWHVF